MKSLIKKFKTFLDSEYEIPLPKLPARHKKQHYVKHHTSQPPKQPAGYVNPFKHQQTLDRERILRELQETKRRIELERQKKLRQTVKPQVHTPQPTQSVFPGHLTPEPQHPAQVQTQIQTHPETKPEKPAVQLPKFKKTKITLPNLPKIPKLPNLPTKHILHVAKKRPALFASVIGGILILGIWAVTGFYMPQPGGSEQKDKQAQNEIAPAQEVAEAVGKKITLPTDEEPVSATVSDKSVLQNQAFFEEAQNGDKILMYKKNKKAYLYRPKTDEVITYAELQFQEDGEASVAAATR